MAFRNRKLPGCLKVSSLELPVAVIIEPSWLCRKELRMTVRVDGKVSGPRRRDKFMSFDFNDPRHYDLLKPNCIVS